MHPTDEAWFMLQANCHNIPREEAEKILRDYEELIQRAKRSAANGDPNAAI